MLTENLVIYNLRVIFNFYYVVFALPLLSLLRQLNSSISQKVRRLTLSALFVFRFFVVLCGHLTVTYGGGKQKPFGRG